MRHHILDPITAQRCSLQQDTLLTVCARHWCFCCGGRITIFITERREKKHLWRRIKNLCALFSVGLRVSDLCDIFNTLLCSRLYYRFSILTFCPFHYRSAQERLVIQQINARSNHTVSCNPLSAPSPVLCDLISHILITSSSFDTQKAALSPCTNQLHEGNAYQVTHPRWEAYRNQKQRLLFL